MSGGASSCASPLLWRGPGPHGQLDTHQPDHATCSRRLRGDVFRLWIARGMVIAGVAGCRALNEY